MASVTGHLRDDGDHQRSGKEPHAVGERARDDEDDGRDVFDVWPEAALQQFVRREQIAAEVGGDEEHADEEAADDVADARAAGTSCSPRTPAPGRR